MVGKPRLAGVIDPLVRRIQDREGALGRGQRALDSIVHPAELTHRLVEHENGREKGKERARRGRPGDHLLTAVPDHRGHAQRA